MPSGPSSLPANLLTALTQRSVDVLRAYSAKKKNADMKANEPLRTWCFYQQVVSKHHSTWSNEEGKCEECMKADRQCFYYLDAETIRVMAR